MKNYKRAKHLLLPSLEENIQTHTLPNQIHIFTKHLPYLFSVTVGIWVPVGSASEPYGKEGLAHFLEHLFFKGTKTKTTREIMEAIECKGGQINAFTTQEYTCFYIKTLADYQNLSIEILADILKNSTFKEIEKERNVILEEISSLEDTPEENIIELYHQFVWQNHSLSKPVLGTIQSVSQITKRDIASFYKKVYTSQNIIVTVVGNFDEKELLQSFHHFFNDFPRHIPPTELQKQPLFHAGTKHHSRKISQIHFCLGFPAPSITEQERSICELATNILGGGSTSRLFYRIREQEGLAYNIFSFNDLFRYAGTFGIYAGVAPENFEKVLNIIFQEIEKLKNETISKNELDLYRQELIGELLLAHEDPSTHMTRIGKSIIYENRIVSIKEILSEYDQITPKQICNFFKKYCQPANTALISLGPEKYKLKINSILL
ncbi:MAG TPA: pitrilysin family protein [Candidatus Hydrogenedens sp.]|nr:pitrilysin family protein [Candidatus Hydrogenedens sp.]